MTAVSASFPAYRATQVAFRAGIPASAHLEGMRELSMSELDYVGGAGFWNGLTRAVFRGVCVGLGALVGMVNPIAGAITGAFLWEIVTEELSKVEF